MSRSRRVTWAAFGQLYSLQEEAWRLIFLSTNKGRKKGGGSQPRIWCAALQGFVYIPVIFECKSLRGKRKKSRERINWTDWKIRPDKAAEL